MRPKTIVVVDPSSHPQDVLGPLYAKGLIGAWNGYAYNEGGGVVAVEVIDPRALDEIDAHPKLTRLPSHTDPTLDAVKQSHIDKLHPEVKEHLKGEDKLDKDHKLKGNMSGRELHQHLHDTYKNFTAYLHPDF